MSKGTQVYPVRLPQLLVEMAQATIRFRGVGKTGKAWTLSDFIRVAMAEKVKKMDRSRGRSLANELSQARTQFLDNVKSDELAELKIEPPAFDVPSTEKG
jgi:hypothetical protein